MSESAASAEPFRGNSEPVSVAVSEHVAARRLGVSLDMLRRDRRTGKLGIPFIKIGEGKRGLVRYDLTDLDRWVEEKKRVGRMPAARIKPPVVEEGVEQPEPPVEPRAPEPDLAEPPPLSRRSPPRTMWEALAETVLAEPEDDPFATAGRATPRRAPGGYFGG
jgi:hypothetical protein